MYKQGRLDEALSLNARGLKIAGLSEPQRLEFFKQRYNLLAALGDRLDALNALAYIHSHEARPEAKTNAQARAIEIVNLRLNQNELDKVVDNDGLGFVHPQAAYRLALFRLKSKDFDGARACFPKPPNWDAELCCKNRLKVISTQIDSRRRVEPYTSRTVLSAHWTLCSDRAKTLKVFATGPRGIYGSDRAL